MGDYACCCDAVEDERVTPVYLIYLLGSVIHYERSGRPVVPGMQPSPSVQSSQPPQQQVAQQPEHQRFRPPGRQFKKKSGSSSSGSGSSSSGSSSKVEYCGQCGGKHPTAQCVGVQGSCNVCGQYGHFARVCPLSGSQHTAAPLQGRGGSSRGRSFLAQQQRLGEPQFRPFQQPDPLKFGQSSHPQFSGPLFSQDSVGVFRFEKDLSVRERRHFGFQIPLALAIQI
ncbi:hypothetical protein F511_25166 [Dorcoceras hygrometricum]|uniref:CCHC-type domain-containing protein n=1 Tax=Dorcoceras hygrometricum TaxID=472368 RepID=A0A2Z7BQ31_9LAMI|nr:hypothetical protein F511_25166 [Dorcoceras hygrometricum]